MYSVYRTHGGKVRVRKLSREEARERVLYWALVHLGAVGFFLACCLAAGLP